MLLKFTDGQFSKYVRLIILWPFSCTFRADKFTAKAFKRTYASIMPNEVMSVNELKCKIGCKSIEAAKKVPKIIDELVNKEVNFAASSSLINDNESIVVSIMQGIDVILEIFKN